MKQIMPKILNDIKVDLADEFDKNFERKAFFDKPWKARKFPDKGSLLMQLGVLLFTFYVFIKNYRGGIDDFLLDFAAIVKNKGGIDEFLADSAAIFVNVTGNYAAHNQQGLPILWLRHYLSAKSPNTCPFTSQLMPKKVSAIV